MFISQPSTASQPSPLKLVGERICLIIIYMNWYVHQYVSDLYACDGQRREEVIQHRNSNVSSLSRWKIRCDVCARTSKVHDGFLHIAFFHLNSSWSCSIYLCLHFSGVIWRAIASLVCSLPPPPPMLLFQREYMCNGAMGDSKKKTNINRVQLAPATIRMGARTKNEISLFRCLLIWDDQSTVNV